MRMIMKFVFLSFFSAVLIVGCADFFAPGLRETTEQLTTDVETVITEQGGLTTLIDEGRRALELQIEAAKASIETINFRSEEDKAGAVAVIALLEAKVEEAGEAATAAVAGFDAKVNKLIGDAQGMAEEFAAADTPGAALSVLGQMLVPFLGPYAPVGEIALALLGLGGTARVTSRRGKTSGATSVLVPIEKARMKNLEDQLAANDPTRKFIVFDAGVTSPAFAANGAKSIIDGFG